jgi:hypothetical protein
MSSSSIRAGKAFVEISTDKSLFDKGVAAVQASMRRLSTTASTIGGSIGSGLGVGIRGLMGPLGMLAGAGAAGMTGLAGGALAAGKAFADAGSKIDDMSQRTGMTAEEVSKLQYAAQQSGTSIESVEKAIRKMQKASGGKSGMSASAEFAAIADKIAAISDPSEQAAAAMAAFGNSGAELLPLLADGSAGLDKMGQRASELGLVMSGEDANAAATLGDSFDELWASLGGVTNAIGAALAPMLTSMVSGMTTAISIISNWISDNRELIATIFSISTYINLGSQALSYMLSMFETLAGTGGALATGLMERWNELTGWIMPVIDGITTALMSGQWEAAGNLAILGLEKALRVGVQPIYNLWTDFYTFVINGAISAATSVANTFASIPTAIMNGFSTAITWLTGTWDETVNWIAKKLLYLYSLFDSSIEYEATAKQMDADAASRAKGRQASLDKVTGERSAALAAANADRAAFGAGMINSMTAIANERKSQFEGRIQQIGEEITQTLGEVNTEAEAQAAAKAAAAATAGSTAAAKTPTLAAVAETVSSKSSGTFSSFAAGMFGSGGSSIDRLVDNSKKTNSLLEKIADNTAGDDAATYDS